MLEVPIMTGGKCQNQVVLEELERVLRSKLFSGSPRLSQFLRYTVEHTLQGEMSELKEVCIGMAVFSKPASYDPKIEPIVRVEARRLRARLDEYYSDESRSDSVRIYLPKGSYQAQFEEIRNRIIQAPDSPTQPQQIEPATPEATTKVLPYENRPSAVPVATRRMGRSARAFTLVAVISFSAGIGAVLLSRLANPSQYSFKHIVPLTSYPGNELEPAISHDGKQLAFVWGGEHGDNYDIYVKLLDLGTPVRLTTDAAHDLAPQWSPDDRFISFLRVSKQGMSVFVLPAMGGVERKVADLHMPTAWKSDALQVHVGSGAAWSADGTQLILTDEEEPDNGTAALYAVPLDGLPRRRITSPPSLGRDFDAAVAHNGRRIAFIRETSNASGDLFVSDMNGGNLHQITHDQMRIQGVTWTPDDRSLIFASNRGGASELWQVAAEGGTPESIAAKGDDIAYPSLSDGGDILAYTSTAQNSDIWRVPMNLTKMSTAMRPDLLIASTGRNNSPQYSPDGRKIAFISDRSGSWELWVGDSDGHDLRQLTNFGGPMVGTPHWSPDGHFLVFDARPKGHSVIFTIALDGGNPRPITDDSSENKMPNWSRDGLSIYYTSNRLGPSQLWRSGVHGEHPTRLTTQICYDSAESMDGKFIYFESDRDGIYRLPVAGGKAELVNELADVYPSRYFDVLDQIYFVNQENVPRLIQQYDPESRKLSTIGTISGQLADGPSLSISPDRSFILFAQQDSSSSEIMALRK